MKRLFTLPILITATLLVGSALAQRQEQLLDSGWRFSKTDPGAAMNPAFDDSGWRPVRVPRAMCHGCAAFSPRARCS